MAKGFFEESLKRLCNEKFGADAWVDGSYRDDMGAGTVEFIVRDRADVPVISLENLEELSLMLGTSHIALRPIYVVGYWPAIRFRADRVVFICPG
jgi:hypothetical protein